MDTLFQWTVIGAGPAGIASIGQLIDAGVTPNQIAWIDPTFTVGDFATVWKRVLSNTPVESFMKFYTAFEAFEFNSKHEKFMIEQMKPMLSCPLMVAAQPLKWITKQLQTKVASFVGSAHKLTPAKNSWQISLMSGHKINTKKVIIAIGAEAKTLPHANLEVISLKTASDPAQLKKQITSDDCVAVFGSYQSAKTVEEGLMATNVKKVIHFYRSERSFNRHVGGLELPDKVSPTPMTPANLIKYIPECNKVIYAVGFERRHISIEGLAEDYTYNTTTGQIAPGVYGLGIAFPEVVPYTNGRREYKVTAIWPFMKHLQKVFPIWMADEEQPASRQTTSETVVL